MFGESANTLLPPQATRLGAEEFLTAFDKTLQGVDRRIFFRGALFLFGRDRKWEQAYGRVHAFVDKYIDRAVTQRNDDLEKSLDTSSRPFSMVGELVKESQNRLFLRDHLLSIFFPARDTTSIGISDIFFHLARNPDVWKKLREEVLALDDKETLSFEVLKSMKYLQSVINESA